VLTLATAAGLLLQALVLSAGCGASDDRDSWEPDAIPPGGSETGAGDGSPGDDGGDDTPDEGDDDGGAPPDAGPGDDTSDPGDTDEPGDGDEPPPDDDGEGLPTLPWNCEGFQPNYPDERPYHTAKELCAWINNCRSAYSFHSRYPCGGPEVYPGEVTPAATWPIELAWDSAAAAEAQAEADALAAGGSPRGRLRDSPLDQCADHGDYRLWFDSIDDQTETISRPYVVTARDNDISWTNRCSALGKGFAFFRLGLAYVDDCGDPTITRFGCGLAEADDGDQWAVIWFVS
jgi:hypothetical protein